MGRTEQGKGGQECEGGKGVRQQFHLRLLGQASSGKHLSQGLKVMKYKLCRYLREDGPKHRTASAKAQRQKIHLKWSLER